MKKIIILFTLVQFCFTLPSCITANVESDHEEILLSGYVSLMPLTLKRTIGLRGSMERK